MNSHPLGPIPPNGKPSAGRRMGVNEWKVVNNADEPAAWIIVSFITTVPLWVFPITIEDSQSSPSEHIAGITFRLDRRIRRKHV